MDKLFSEDQYIENVANATYWNFSPGIYAIPFSKEENFSHS